MPHLVIFDWDGTLCNSLLRIADCMQLAAGELGIEPPAEEAVREIVGLGLAEAFQQLYPGIDDRQVDELRCSYSRHFVEQDKQPSPFYPYVDEVLDRLKKQGMLLAVATGKSRRGLDRVLDSRQNGGLFSW